MRVNMDSSILGDPRFKLVAQDLGVNFREVIGACYLLWLACYERRSVRFRLDEADVAAGVSGFASALIRRELATEDGDDAMIVHGVEKRIAFLDQQKRRGAKGGKNSGKARRKRAKTPEANASAPAEANASSTAQAYTPAPAPALTPAPDVTPKRRGPDPVPVTPGAQTPTLVGSGWVQASPIATTEHLEAALASAGLRIQLSPTEKGVATSLIRAGAIAWEEFSYAVAATRAAVAKGKGSRPVSYLLAVVSGQREAAAAAANTPSPGPAAPDGDAAAKAAWSRVASMLHDSRTVEGKLADDPAAQEALRKAGGAVELGRMDKFEITQRRALFLDAYKAARSRATVPEATP